jgi:putative transposase
MILCRVLQVSRSGYYAWTTRLVSAQAAKRIQLIEVITTIHDRSLGTHGSPRILADLHEKGYVISRKTVAKLMRSADIAGCSPHRYQRTTIADQGTQLPADLVKGVFDQGKPDTVWIGDITYIRTGQGWMYLATVIDAHTRKVVGWSMADHMKTSLIIDALNAAVITRKPKDVIFHSDRGCQYTSTEFAHHCKKNNVRRSVGRTGICWNNAAAESFFATLKKELI